MYCIQVDFKGFQHCYKPAISFLKWWIEVMLVNKLLSCKQRNKVIHLCLQIWLLLSILSNWTGKCAISRDWRLLILATIFLRELDCVNRQAFPFVLHSVLTHHANLPCEHHLTGKPHTLSDHLWSLPFQKTEIVESRVIRVPEFNTFT